MCDPTKSVDMIMYCLLHFYLILMTMYISLMMMVHIKTETFSFWTIKQRYVKLIKFTLFVSNLQNTTEWILLSLKMVGSDCFSRTPFSSVPRATVVQPCQGHTHKRIDVFVLAKGGDGVPTKPPDEGKTGWIVWWIWRHSAVEQWELLSITQRWRRRTERHLKHATYRLQRTSCGVTKLRAFNCKGLHFDDANRYSEHTALRERFKFKFKNTSMWEGRTRGIL